MSQITKDKQTADSITRLKSQPDYRLYAKHLQDRLDTVKALLVTAPAADVPALQGRAQELLDILAL